MADNFSLNSTYRKLIYVARQIFGIQEILPKDNSFHAGADADVTKSFIQYPENVISNLMANFTLVETMLMMRDDV